MKILKELAKAGEKLRIVAGLEKADDPGIYVSRQVLNGKDWEKWAKGAGIPSPLAAADMHVTIVSSPIRVNMRPQTEPLQIGTDRACVCLMGPKEDVLTVVFESWILLDRWWDFYSAGAMGTWTSYRPHITLSYSAAGFQISDEALAQMPQSIILGEEVYAPQGVPAVDDTGEGADNDDDELIEIDIAAAQKAIDGGKLPLIEEIDLRKAVLSKKAPKSVAKRLTPKPVAFEVDGVKTVEREMVMTVQALPEAIRKATAAANLFKSNEEERLVIGWASVATVKGEPVVDLQGDTITVKAQREFLHSLLRNQRASKFEHMGDSVNEVVGGLIMDADLQRALGIDLGMEGMLVEIYVPDDQNWEMVKSGDWMYSIAGTVLVVE